MRSRFFGVRQDEVFEGLGPDAWSQLRLEREVCRGEHRDEWDNWDGQFVEDQESLGVPIVDRKYRKAPFKWREKHPFALAITHDIDVLDPFSATEYWAMVRKRLPSVAQSARFAAGFVKNSVERKIAEKYLGQQQTWDFKSWLDSESRFGFRSTWFAFPLEVGRRSNEDCTYRWGDAARWSKSETMPFIEAIRKTSELGWEVGLHASIHAATDTELLRKQKQDIERALGKPVTSVRQHYLRYDPSRTPAVHQSAGFLVDSTLGMNRRIGFRAGTSFPFFVYDHATLELTGVLEMPLILQDVALFNRLDLGYAEAKAKAFRLLDEIERVNGVFTLLFHPDCQFNAPIWDLFNELLEECHRRGAWGATLSELREFWLSGREGA